LEKTTKQKQNKKQLSDKTFQKQTQMEKMEMK